MELAAAHNVMSLQETRGMSGDLATMADTHQRFGSFLAFSAATEGGRAAAGSSPGLLADSWRHSLGSSMWWLSVAGRT